MHIRLGQALPHPWRYNNARGIDYQPFYITERDFNQNYHEFCVERTIFHASFSRLGLLDLSLLSSMH